MCQDRRGHSTLQEHPWVSQQTDQEELCQEQMEGKCCGVFVVLALFSRLWYSSTTTPWSTACLLRSWITVQLSPRSPDVSGINPHHPLVSWRRWWFCLYEELAQYVTFSCRELILHPALNLIVSKWEAGTCRRRLCRGISALVAVHWKQILFCHSKSTLKWNIFYLSNNINYGKSLI